MAVTPEIKTKFTIDGMRQAVTGLRAIGRAIGETFASTRRSGGDAFDPVDKSLIKVEKRAKTTAKEVAKVGKKHEFHPLRIAALAAGAAIAGLALKFAALSKTAIDSAKQTADSLKEIGLDAQKIGATPQDVSVLGFAGERTGVDRDELITQIATISNEFLTVRDNIAKAGSAYSSFLNLEAKDAALAAKVGGAQGFRSQVSGFWERDIEARKASLGDIDRRIAEIDGQLNTITAEGPQYAGQADLRLLNAARDTALERERQQLVDARNQFKQSQSPQGQALFELQDYGLDFQRATKGGIDGLVALSEAFQRIPDASARARVAMRLFGEDTGVKLIPILMGGEKAIREYREEMEKFGGVVTQEDVDRATAYKSAVQNMQTAIGGVKLEIGRNLLPYLTESVTAITNWIVKSRVAIATYVTEAFLGVRTFAEDVISIFSGDTSDIQTKWLDAVVQKTAELRDLWSDAVKQIALLWQGKDSDYKWLNSLRDGFVEVKKFASDAWAVVTGGKAQNFEWLNSARDQVVAFAGRLSDAFGMLKDLLSAVADFFRPVFAYLGQDVATVGLFLGLTKMVGLFGTLTAVAGVFGKALGGVFALGGAAATAGKAVAGVGGAAGGVAATAATLTSSLTAVGASISTLISGAAILGATLVGAFALGQKAAQYMLQDTDKAYEKVWAAQAELMRAQAQPYINDKLRRRDDAAKPFLKSYWQQEGIDIGYQGMTAAEREKLGRDRINTALGFTAMTDGDGNDIDLGASARASEARRGPVSKRVAVDLNVNGRPTTLYGDEVSAGQFTRDLEYATRDY